MKPTGFVKRKSILPQDSELHVLMKTSKHITKLTKTARLISQGRLLKENGTSREKELERERQHYQTGQKKEIILNNMQFR